jgi:hypothetical protein
MRSIRVSVLRWFGLGLLLVAIAYAVTQALQVLQSNVVGIDFLPLRHAATDLLSGRSVYTDKDFVYPPAAAALLLPVAWGSSWNAFACWIALSAAAPLVAALLIARASAARPRMLVFGVAAIVLCGGTAVTNSMALGNLTLLLVPLAAWIVISFEQGRWRTGCGALAATLLLKPLLAPLLLVPVVKRRWAPLAVTMSAGAAALAVSIAVVPGGTAFFRILAYCLGGTNLHGTNAVNNLSLRGWVEAHGAPRWTGMAASLVVAAIVGTIIWRQQRRATTPGAALANQVLLATLLVGAISEIHFLVVVVATVLAELAMRPSRRRLALRLPGLVMLALPMSYLDLITTNGLAQQTWYVAAELVLLTGALLDGMPLPARARAPRWSRAVSVAAGR